MNTIGTNNKTKLRSTKPKKSAWNATTKKTVSGYSAYIRLFRDNKRERVSPIFVASTKGEAKSLAEEWSRKNLQNLQNSTATTVENYIQSFFARSKWAASSKQLHQTTFEKHIKGSNILLIPISHITKQHIIDFMSPLQGTEQTKYRVWNLLNSIFIAALMDDKITQNPCRYYGHPKKKAITDANKIKALDTAAEVQLLKFVKNEPFWNAIVLLGIDLGLREAEILGLQFGDYSEDGEIHIQRTCDTLKINGIFSAVIKKGTKANKKGQPVTRKVWMSQPTLEALNKLKSIARGRPTDYIFTDGKNLYTRQKFYSQFKAMIKKSGLPHTTFHQLRHTAASNLVDAGYSILDVAKRLGHTNSEMLVKRYGHSKDEKQQHMALTQSERFRQIGDDD